MNRPADAFQLLLAALDRLEIPYMIGGSVASSIHGVGRATVDVDVVVQLPATSVPDLIDELKTSFYCDLETAVDAVRHGRSFNAIHLATAYKFDLFPVRGGSYDQASFARRVFREGRVFSEQPVEFCVASPEDTILSKLRWYRQGGAVSERQLEDVAGIVHVQGEQLDWEYMQRWAPEIGVADLLARFSPPTD